MLIKNNNATTSGINSESEAKPAEENKSANGPDFYEEWQEDACKIIENTKKELMHRFEEIYDEGMEIETKHWNQFLKAYSFYQCSTVLCDKDKIFRPDDPELVPSLAWIRHILFPDMYPYPADEDGPSGP